MNIKHLIISILILLSASTQATQAQSKTTYTAIEQQSENLDSLVNLWYFKRSNIQAQSPEKSKAVVMSLDKMTDSLYIQRLQAVPSLFPVSYNDKVRAWIEMYIKRNQQSSHVIGLTEYYFPIFEEILDYYELPLELKYLPFIESALNPRAKSRAGAVGLWQFLYSTGKMYGLEINSYVDERKDPVKSTHAAAHFLKDMYSVYGDWTLVIAAYNCGPGNVNKAIRRAGGKTNYWEIYPYLPRETRGYVPAFISALYLMNYYPEHGIELVKPDMKIFTDTVMVNEKVHLMQISEVMGIPFEELVELNPQYRKYIIPGNAHPYPLRLPVQQTGKFIAVADSVYHYKDSILLGGQDIVITPPSFKRSKYKSYSYGTTKSSYKAPSTAGKKKIYYTVKQGDNYGFIASWYNVRVSDLKYWNNSYSNRLDIGQKLEVWVPIKKYDRYKNINSLTFEQKQAKSAKMAASSGRPGKTKPTDNRYVWYKLRQGDNLWTISQQYPGVSDSDIKRINGFSNSDLRRLQTGQYIKIKRK